MAMRTLDDNITQMTLKNIQEEINRTEGNTRTHFEQLKSMVLRECTLFEQSIKDKTNAMKSLATPKGSTVFKQVSDACEKKVRGE